MTINATPNIVMNVSATTGQLAHVPTDQTAPVITYPATSSLQFANGTAGLYTTDQVFIDLVNSVTAVDDVDGSVPVTNDSASLPSPMLAGNYTVTWSAQDAAGNIAIAQTVITVSESAAAYLNTYADRTKLVTATATGGGDGSEANPWTLSEACLNAVAGDIVGVQAGVYVGTPTNIRYEPSFKPTNSGTSANPIVFVAENQASLVSTGYSDIRSGSTTVGSGNPAFGNLAVDYVYWIGFYSDENYPDNKVMPDCGTAQLWTTTGSKIAGCKLIGIQTTYVDNHAGIRTENCFDSFVSDNKISGYLLNGAGASVNQAGIETYETQGTVFEYNDIDSCGNAFYFKARPHYGNIIRYNKISNSGGAPLRIGGFVVSPIDGSRNQIYQNICIDDNAGIELAYSAPVPEAITGTDIFNNIFYHSSPLTSIASGLYITDSIAARDVTFKNNIVYAVGSSSVLETYNTNAAASFAAYVDTDYNIAFGQTYFSHGNSSSDFYNKDLATWQALTGHDVHTVITDPLFTDATNLDFTLSASSPALNFGLDYRQILGGVQTDSINAGCYVSSGQNEKIGIR